MHEVDNEFCECIKQILFKKKRPQREALISQIYFWNRTLHVSDSISVHH